MKIKTNLWGGVLFVVLGIVLWLLVPSQIPEPLIETPGIAPRLVPRLVIGIMFLGGLTLIIQSLVFKKEKIVEVHLKYEKTALIISLIMGVYAVLVYLVGFLIGTVVSVALMLFYYRVRKISNYMILISIGVGVYFVFVKVFKIGLPEIGGALW